MESSIQSLEENLKLKEDEIILLKDEKEKVKKDLDSLKQKHISLKVEKEELCKEQYQLEKENERLLSEVDNLKKQTQPLEGDVMGNQADGPDETSGNEETVTQKAHKSENISKEGVGQEEGQTSKVEQAILLSKGGIEDFPAIVNDSKAGVCRSILSFYNENDEEIDADEYFTNSSAEEIATRSRKLSGACMEGKILWKCAKCKGPIKIAHIKDSLFFVHADRDSDVDCPWRNPSMSSGSKSSDKKGQAADNQKKKIDELKEKIKEALMSESSRNMGISDVRVDGAVHGHTGYMRWRKPDISFMYNGRPVALELQKKSHNTDFIVDKDRFYRLNGIQVIWIFGSDSDTSYDYMRGLNYKETLFDNHRNVFVFDKDAQALTEEKGILMLKCNWLNPANEWAYNVRATSANGKMVSLDELTYDDEYCKPYYYDANKAYFEAHKSEKERYEASRESREKLAKRVENEWLRGKDYKEALHQMKENCIAAIPFQEGGLWGFRFRKTMLIAPVFVERPVELSSGYYKVRVAEGIGIVNEYAEKVVDWSGGISCEDMDMDVTNQRVMFKRDDKWGLADINGDELISPLYFGIEPWNSKLYKVRLEQGWGLCDINGEIVAPCEYANIGRLMDGRAEAAKINPDDVTTYLHGYLDENGNEMVSQRIQNPDSCITVESFEQWELFSSDGHKLLPPKFDNIEYWSDHLYRISSNDLWGIYNVQANSFLLEIEYDHIGNLAEGVAEIKRGHVSRLINAEGKDVAQKVVKLAGGWTKSLIAGKWGIENEKGEEIVKHLYDEIGSFRSRLIGVINKRVIKLDADYCYPIHILGKLCGQDKKGYNIDVAGVACRLSKKACCDLSQQELFSSKRICVTLAFSNLVFGLKKYNLRVVKGIGMSKKLSKGDKDSDFVINQVVKGKIVGIISNKKQRRKVLVEFEDGRRTSVARRMFVGCGKDISSCVTGSEIILRKVGFDDERDQTVWKIEE